MLVVVVQAPDTRDGDRGLRTYQHVDVLAPLSELSNDDTKHIKKRLQLIAARTCLARGCRSLSLSIFSALSSHSRCSVPARRSTPRWRPWSTDGGYRVGHPLIRLISPRRCVPATGAPPSPSSSLRPSKRRSGIISGWRSRFMAKNASRFGPTSMLGCKTRKN